MEIQPCRDPICHIHFTQSGTIDRATLVKYNFIKQTRFSKARIHQRVVLSKFPVMIARSSRMARSLVNFVLSPSANYANPEAVAIYRGCRPSFFLKLPLLHRRKRLYSPTKRLQGE